ncbi:MAG: hypothetical protein DRG30_03030, partial [Epsilonproteobacteria bacterium]
MIDASKIIGQSNCLKLLYVEDNKKVRESILIILQEFFSDIIVAVDGEDGFEKFQENSVDLIITDINMPRLNGLEMIAKIKEIEDTIPVLISSAHTESNYFVDSIKLGIDGYLLKPFDLDQFIVALSNAIGKIQLKKTEKELSKQHKYLQTIIDGIEDPIMVIREDYSIEVMNTVLHQEVDKYQLADPKHPKCYEISHHRSAPCDGDEHPCPLKKVMESHKYTTVVHNHSDLNGKASYVEIAASPLFDHQDNCIGIIESARNITEHITIQDTLRKQKTILNHQAHHDYLTGLPNRVLFGDRLRETIKRSDRNKEKFALLFIDLDQFKHINDSLGHEVGDEVLQIVSHRISGLIREEDTFARLGGDEFTIIMGQLQREEDASQLAQKILDAFADPIQVSHHSLYISNSIGISLFPQDDRDVNNLLKYADTAMYKAKENGRNNFQFYASEMTEKALVYMTTEADLRKALKDIQKEFVIHYQPQVNAESGVLIGVEALIRWQHPSRGLLTPDKFMSIVEGTGLIVPLDRWVMRTAMRQVVQWYDKGLNPGVLAINLTMKHLEQETFGDLVVKMMEETGMKPQWLELEVLESQIMSNPNNV